MNKLNHVIVKHLGQSEWQVYKPFKYKSIVVPKGYITDFGSIPWIFWSIFPKNGDLYEEATVVHDWLYSTKILKRREADLIFYQIMLDYGVPRWRALMMYYAVRLFGWYGWDSVTKDERIINLRLLYRKTNNKDIRRLLRELDVDV